jgi:1-pyrroline-5-carboxylate dehydrogenase
MSNSPVPVFATIDPFKGMKPDQPGIVRNLLAGVWLEGDHLRGDIPDPLHGGHFLQVPDTRELDPFIQSLKTCPKSGLHNPLKNPQRYIELGQVCAKAARLLADEAISSYFTRLIQRVMPKSWHQAMGEVTVTRIFLENFSGDGVRFLARGFSNPGDRPGQESRGYRWPFGPVAIIGPFNFPLEITALQLMGALFMGNRVLLKVDSRVSCVIEQFIRLLIHAGLPAANIDLIHCRGKEMGRLLEEARDDLRLVQFTGSSQTAEWVSSVMRGKVRLEDAGFDWKIIGPDFQAEWLEYVAWQCDQDAYNTSGQKCSAQSLLFVHHNWAGALLPRLGELAALRKLDDLTIGPLLSWSNDRIQAHMDAVLATEGAHLLFGGKPLVNHSIPDCYGAWQPTAIEVPLATLAGSDFDLITTELFGPFQIVVRYGDDDIPSVLNILERLSHHLTAAVVSADVDFQSLVLGATVNGTSYCGMRARTTAAPQNHWFGPCGDPRAAGIGTPESIISTWSGHREIIMDQGSLAPDWAIPELV